MKKKAITTLALLAVLATGCADRQSGPPVPETPADKSDFPTEVTAANGTVKIESRPSKIVSLSATATEMLFAIDAGEQVVAVDSTSNFPPEAPITDLAAFTPNLEAIAGYEPDLVVVGHDTQDVVAGLERLETPTLYLPAASNLAETYEQIETLGAATGHVDDAEELTSKVKEEISTLTARVPEPEEPLTYYHELGPDLFSVTSATFAGEVYGLAGLRNIADAVPDQAEGYPQLSNEFIVDADPDFIFLADTKCCGQNLQTVKDRPGWSNIESVKRSRVIELDDDVASRWGPRVVEFLRVIVDAVEPALQPA